MKEKNNRKKTNKKKGIRFYVLLGIGILALAAVIGLLIYNATKNREEEPTEVSEVPDVGEPTKPAVVYGDPESDTYDFIGDYFDRAGENTTLSITRGDEEGSLSISIFSIEDDYTSYSWQIDDAVYDSDCKALLYEGCTYMRYLSDPADPDADPEVFELSSDGSGKIFLHDDALVWLDDLDQKGDSMLFTRRTAE